MIIVQDVVKSVHAVQNDITYFNRLSKGQESLDSRVWASFVRIIGMGIMAYFFYDLCQTAEICWVARRTDRICARIILIGMGLLVFLSPVFREERVPPEHHDL